MSVYRVFGVHGVDDELPRRDTDRMCVPIALRSKRMTQARLLSKVKGDSYCYAWTGVSLIAFCPTHTESPNFLVSLLYSQPIQPLRGSHACIHGDVVEMMPSHVPAEDRTLILSFLPTPPPRVHCEAPARYLSSPC